MDRADLAVIRVAALVAPEGIILWITVVTSVSQWSNGVRVPEVIIRDGDGVRERERERMLLVNTEGLALNPTHVDTTLG